jgi:hypothetical protein
MEKLTIQVTRALSVSFASNVLLHEEFGISGTGCNACQGGCDSGQDNAKRELTVHEVVDEVLLCVAAEEPRTLQARYVVTEREEAQDNVALRAFKDAQELKRWVSSIGCGFKETKRHIEHKLNELLPA